MKGAFMNLKRFILPVLICTCTIISIVIVSCDQNSKSTEIIPISSGPKKIFLYGTSSTYDGNLGGRSGADAICAADANKPSSVKTSHALISVSNSDAVDDMPVNYTFPGNVKIVGPDGVTVVANSWPDLLDGSIETSLTDAGVLPIGKKGSAWWSGSDANGELSSNNCTGWTVNSVVNGEFGWAYTLNTDPSWIDNSNTTCGASLNFVCLGY
jgi:hypothetical protein